MDPIVGLLLGLGAGLAVGAGLGWLAARLRGASGLSAALADASKAREQSAGQVASAQSRAEAAEAQLKESRAEAAEERTKRAAADQARATADAQRAALEARERELREFVERSRTEFQNAFQALSKQALESSSRSFLDLAKQAFKADATEAASQLEARKKEIETLVTPLKESLGKLDLATQEMDKRRVSAYATIEELVRGVREQTKTLEQRAGSLEASLRGSSQARGRWGEVALRNVVELAGMTEHCDFHEQTATDDGTRPDFTIRMPNAQRIAVDSKAPLSAYLEACEATEDVTRTAALRKHAADLRVHVKALSSKAYWERIGEGIDFVVLFLPGDSFLSAAFEGNSEIFDEAARARVLLATPVTLLALLRSVALSWQQARVAENAKEIAATAKELYDRAAVFSRHLAAIGKGLTSATSAYNQAVGSYQLRLIPVARRLEELGAADRSSKEVASLESVDLTARALPAPAQGENGDGTAEGDPDVDAEDAAEE